MLDIDAMGSVNEGLEEMDMVVSKDCLGSPMIKSCWVVSTVGSQIVKLCTNIKFGYFNYY